MYIHKIRQEFNLTELKGESERMLELKHTDYGRTKYTRNESLQDHNKSKTNIMNAIQRDI